MRCCVGFFSDYLKKMMHFDVIENKKHYCHLFFLIKEAASYSAVQREAEELNNKNYMGFNHVETRQSSSFPTVGNKRKRLLIEFPFTSVIEIKCKIFLASGPIGCDNCQLFFDVLIWLGRLREVSDGIY